MTHDPLTPAQRQARFRAKRDNRIKAMEARIAELKAALRHCAECDPESAMFAQAALGEDA